MVLHELFEIETDDRKWEKVIGLVKIGKVISFAKQNDVDKNSFGDWEFIKLAKFFADNPNVKVMLVSNCDFNKLTEDQKAEIFPHKNVVYCGGNILGKIHYERKMYPEFNEVTEWHVIEGPNTRFSEIYKLKNRKGTEAKTLLMFKLYQAPLIYLMNNIKRPTFAYVTDNRYFYREVEWFTRPKFIVAQFSDESLVHTGDTLSIKDENDIDYKTTEYTIESARFESLYLYGKQYPTFDFSNRTNKLLIVANQVRPDLNRRYYQICEYVIDQNIDADIIGCWESEEAITKFGSRLANPNGVTLPELEDTMKKYKFGLIFRYDTSNKKIAPTSAWITPKVFEYLHAGMIPIIVNCKEHYLDFPDYLKINSPQELKNTVEYLNSLSDNECETLITSLLKKEYYDGSNLRNRLEYLNNKYYS